MNFKLAKSNILAALYIFSILFFALVYFAIWSIRPDYFRVQQDVNFLPIDLLEATWSLPVNEDPASLISPNLSADAASIKIKGLLLDFQAQALALSEKQGKLREWRVEIDEGQSAFEDAMWRQYDDFVALKIAPLEAQLQKVIEEQRSFLANAGVSDPDQLPSGPEAIAYSQLAIAAAQARLDIAEAEVRARDFGLGHLTNFQQSEDQREFLARREKFAKFETEVDEDEQSIAGLRGKLFAAATGYRNSQRSVLNIGDFLYFSVGSATTATFGDIAPNYWVVRLLVCFQVLVSLVSLNIWINRLVSRH
ncbi:ion channel [Agrobacterium sp. ES01]|uniref:potassium channel family protein n=1 Tax=Agrobacterium sp. ES01 TaxID=3420714 RepID=UPI003D0DEC26